MKKYKKAYINSFDCVSCAGNNSKELFSSLCEQKDTISLSNEYIFDKEVAIGKIKTKKTFDELLVEKCNIILENSSLENFRQTLLLVASSVGGMSETETIFFKEESYKNINPKRHPIDAIATKLKEKFSFYDDFSFSTACTSSANALGFAKELIQKGIYKNILIVGADSLSYTTVCGFASLNVLSSEPCRPFDKNRLGMNVAEAVAVLLVQDEKQNSSIELCGVGYSSDAHHMTQPHPEGLGAMKAMKNAILDAQISIKDISYINAHGTGTVANDLSELKAIKTLFKNEKPKVSSSKSITGHTLGAAGAIEAIISCIVLQTQIIPPNKNLQNIEVEDINYSMKMQEDKISYVLSNSFAFGGNNTSLIFGLVK